MGGVDPYTMPAGERSFFTDYLRCETVLKCGLCDSVLPGPTHSEGVERMAQNVAKRQGTDAANFEAEFFRTVRPSSLLKRFATPEELAALVV